MKKLRIFALSAAFVAVLPGLAAAANAYSTANVNMRSGPSTQYPPVLVIPAGVRVDIQGCMRAANWCDVAYAGYRGWVSGRYLQTTYSQRQVYVDPEYYRPLGIPTITFSIGSYWDRHYRDRDFYRDRDSWRDGYYRPRPQPDDEWRRPPVRDNVDDWRRPPSEPSWRDRDREREIQLRRERERELELRRDRDREREIRRARDREQELEIRRPPAPRDPEVRRPPRREDREQFRPGSVDSDRDRNPLRRLPVCPEGRECPPPR
ncbi:SH3 domain-containing protein [Rhizobium sp. KAs_5_22]|uniref:SH3 domain-containing protein n=1 Tax=Ciceribacter selenitireducens TaxID=448181 RepID=UPI0004B6EC7A|nr:SH3 domain-containing protein [Ciceribacter selenitireducens]PPJ45460.1 SH3 domain-containing protein [Rhizobium sp. KAs_5_22]